ncbi:MAG: DUF4019 domain-containing protein [Pedobacter sp.]|nr:MAG: DUF4019 domain-containing protein [Pedobacter sp.]
MGKILQLNGFKTLVVFLLFFIASGCKSNDPYLNRDEDKQEAEEVTNKLFMLIKEKKFEETLKLFGPEFYKKTSSTRLIDVYTMVSKQLGDLKSFEIEKWETKRVEGDKPLGEYFFVFKTHYEKFDASESIRLAREKNGRIRIIAYTINSKHFK